MPSPQDGVFNIKPCPIIGHYNVQRFRQWSPEDCANWYLAKEEDAKIPLAMYPTMGRKHINYTGSNRLIFGAEPRGMFKTIKYAYIVVGNTVFRVDDQYNQLAIGTLESTSTPVYFAFLVVNTIVFACFVDDQKIYIYREDKGTFVTVTDSNAPGVAMVDGKLTKPGYIAAFGNRITVSVANSSMFILSKINLGGDGFDKATCFTNATTGQVFALEDGIIRQMGVLNNTLYIFTDYITGVWSNIPAIFPGRDPPVTFPWKKSSTYNWNFGIANPTTLDINFGIMVFLARNSEGLLQFMVSSGGQPQPINSKAVSTLLQRYSNELGTNSPFLVTNSNGFIYQYEDVIFYRMAGGAYEDTGILDQELTANSIEFNFETETWHRCIELNGNRNRVQRHVYFNQKHLVSITDEGTIYDMSGQYYINEKRNTAQEDDQETDAYIADPFRYERITEIIYEDDYAEFETEYVQIDFVFGESYINYSTDPFLNAQFLIAESPGSDGQPQYLIAETPDADGLPVYLLGEQGNFPTISDATYNSQFNPHISLYWSDDGGITFDSADNREFSQMGVYNWRMRWYQLGTSRNRVYKLIAVSPVPIVVLGAVMNVRRTSGGAN